MYKDLLGGINMSFVDKSCREFIEILGSKEPVPGGGGASALVAAVGTAMGQMTGSLTVGKKKYEAVEAEAKALISRSQKLQIELTELVQKDADIFFPLIEAYKLPAETDDEKCTKTNQIELSLKAACGVPMDIMEKCGEAILLCKRFVEIGNKSAISDAAGGAVICRAALESASLNVFINTKSMRDKIYAEEMNCKAENLLSKYTQIADQVYQDIVQQMK